MFYDWLSINELDDCYWLKQYADLERAIVFLSLGREDNNKIENGVNRKIPSHQEESERRKRLEV